MKTLLKFLFVSVFILTLNADTGLPSSYYKLPTKEAKAYFFKYLGERVFTENKKILEERKFILSLKNNTNLHPNSIQYKMLSKLQEKYKIKELFNYKEYVNKIDIIPPSLALAQAATESGWGKSRFFKKANNIFGHWTYNPEIGMLPLRRPAGKKHFIRIFPSIQASISAYMTNLNRTSVYSEFRSMRKQMRNTNGLINGLTLSSTMDKYSGIGHNYTKILSSIIRKNNLVVMDKIFQHKIKNLNNK